jgi:hypothetical protein
VATAEEEWQGLELRPCQARFSDFSSVPRNLSAAVCRKISNFFEKQIRHKGWELAAKKAAKQCESEQRVVGI